MRHQPLVDGLWICVALGLAWIGGAVGGYAGLAGGAGLGGLCVMALVWGPLLRGYGLGSRRMAAVFQTVTSGGVIAAVALTSIWPLAVTWHSAYLADPWLVFAVAMSMALLGLLLVSWLARRPEPELPASGAVYPEARAVAGLFVNKWHAAGRIWPGAFWRATFLGAMVRVLSQAWGLFADTILLGLPLPGLAIGVATSPGWLGLGGLLGTGVVWPLLAGSLAVWLVLLPLAGVFGATAGGAVPPATLPWSELAAPAAAAAYAPLFGLGAALGALGAACLREIKVWCQRRATGQARAITRACGAVVLVVTVAVALWRYGAADLVSVTITLVVAVPLVLLAIRHLGLIGLPVGGLFAGLAGLAASLARLAETGEMMVLAETGEMAVLAETGGAAALGVALAFGAALVAGEFAQTLHANRYIAGPEAPGPAASLALKTAGVAAGICGSLWAAKLISASAAFGSPGFPAGGATLTSAVISTALRGSLPLGIVVAGVGCALAVELLGRPALLFALGAFLPLPATVALAIGAALSALADRRWYPVASRSTAVSSGLVAGDLAGRGLAAFAVGWGYLALPVAPERPWWALASLGLLLTYIVSEQAGAAPHKRGETKDTLAVGCWARK